MRESICSVVLKDSQERADRLRRVRNLMNLSRKELCEKAEININTYIGYEVGRYGGLTKKGAKKILEYAEKEGVYSSIEWLMNGAGNPPKVVLNIEDDNFYKDKNTNLDEEKNIQEEISLFMEHYSNATFYKIIDDGMLPFYSIGDYVAGIIYEKDEIKYLVGLDCIIKLENGEILFRNLRKGKKDNCYVLFCLNSETQVECPVIYDAKLKFAASIIWHRKSNLQKKEY